MTAFFYFAMSDSETEDGKLLTSVLAASLFFGVFCFPISGFAFLKGLLILRGRMEMVLDTKRLRVMRRFGPCCSTRRCKLSQLGGFRIQEIKSERIRFGVGCSNLFVVRKNGGEFPLLRMYPDEIIHQLAKDLPEKIERLTGRASLVGTDGILAGNLKAERTSIDPLKTQDSTTKPIGSNLEREERGDGYVVRLPRLSKLTSVEGRWGLAGLFAAQLLLTFGLVPALIAGKVKGQPSAGWGIFFVFTTISIFIFLCVISAANRNGSVRINDGRLTFQASGRFGKHFAKWKLESIEAVRVAVEQDTEKPFHSTHFVEVRPDSNKPRKGLDNRDKSELEWNITGIVDYLDCQRCN